MFGKLEREQKGFKEMIRNIVTYAFVKASSSGGTVTLDDLWLRSTRLGKGNIISCMSEPMVRQFFRREIRSNGVTYILTPSARYMEYKVFSRKLQEGLHDMKV